MADTSACINILPPTGSCLFSARLASSKVLSSLLRCVQQLNKVATFWASDYGLKVTTEMNSCVQATAFLQVRNVYTISSQ